jgi:hypothetical protein
MFPSVILSEKKGAFSVMLVNTLSFKDHLEIALEYLKQGGFYGVVTDLANAYNTNRQRVYDILDRVLSAFHPKPVEAREKRIADLEAETASLRARIQALEAKQENSIEVTHQRIRDLSLTLAVLPVSSQKSIKLGSILHPIQQVKKQVTQEFLWLKALHHNMKTFKQGRRKGKSPFQLLGVGFGDQDWIGLMEDYQLAA